MTKRISQIPDFEGKDLLRGAYLYGVSVLGDKLEIDDATTAVLIGLAHYMVSSGVSDELADELSHITDPNT